MGLQSDLEKTLEDLVEYILSGILRPAFNWVVSHPILAIVIGIFLVLWAAIVSIKKEM